MTKTGRFSTRAPRTDPAVFNIPVEKMRAGYYADEYFNKTKALVAEMTPPPVVTMQCFQREHSFAGGVDEAIAILKLCSGYLEDRPEHANGEYPGIRWVDGWDQLEVKALHEGDPIAPWEPVLQITGPYHLFAHLETTILGVMARRSLVMKNVSEVVEAASPKPIWFFPARHDHWVVQTGDGMAAYQAGASSVSTHAGASWWGGKGMGTLPHAVIAAFGGDTVAAAKAFAAKYSGETNVTVLVDFDNTSIDTAVYVANELGEDLWGVRLDNSGTLVDESFFHGSITERSDYGSFKPTGVTPQLVEETRKALDRYGHEHVKIVVSGGFNAAKIKEFESAGVPVDAYGVGSSLLRGSNDYTADVVERKDQVLGSDWWRPVGKVGRFKRDDSRLEVVD